jgi:hypothetical protein
MDSFLVGAFEPYAFLRDLHRHISRAQSNPFGFRQMFGSQGR